VWNLTGGRLHVCDLTNASRTQLLDLRRGVWSDAMLDLFEIPDNALPSIVPSSGICGDSVLGGIPIGALIGDSHAAMFSHGAFRKSAVKATYGTGSSLMMTTPSVSDGGRALSSTVAWSRPKSVQYALEGNITVTGAAVEWLGRVLGLSDHVRDTATLAASVVDSGGVYLVPAFAGLGAPYWDATARGIISGLTRGTTAAHLARATVESIAYQVCDVFEAMRESSGAAPEQLHADGGATRNDTLMQFQADMLGRPVLRNNSADLSAIGAAWLAGLAVGLWKDVCELERLPRSEQRFDPAMAEAHRARLYEGWLEAVARARLSAVSPVKENSRVHGSH
jgi:glycerol kinase